MMSAQADTEQRRKSRKGLLIALVAILIASSGFTLLFGTRIFAYESFRVPSASMEPSVPRGSYVIVKKWGYGHYDFFGMRLFSADLTAPVGRGDVFVFDYPLDPAQSFIKRIVGLPGDVVAYHHHDLSINGRPVIHRSAGSGSASGIDMDFSIESLDGRTYRLGFTAKDGALPVDMVVPFEHQEACSYADSGVTCTVPPGHYFALGDNRDQSADSRHWGFVPAHNMVGRVIKTL